MKLSKTKDMFEYNWYLEEHINQNYLKINKLINIVINIFMVIFLLCFKKVGLISYCFYFLICDMCLTIIDIISISVYKSIDKVFWFFHKIAFSYELKEMSLSEIEKYKNEFSESNAFYQKKIDMLNKQIEEYNKLDNMSYMNKNQYDITYVKDMMTRFKSYNSSPWINEYMKEIVNVSQELLKIISNNNEAISVIINTYQIYSEELLRIVHQYDEMNDEQKTKYEKQLKELLDIFLGHLNKQKIKITNYNEHNIEFDMSFLKKKLQEEEEKCIEQN